MTAKKRDGKWWVVGWGQERSFATLKDANAWIAMQESLYGKAV